MSILSLKRTPPDQYDKTNQFSFPSTSRQAATPLNTWGFITVLVGCILLVDAGILWQESRRLVPQLDSLRVITGPISNLMERQQREEAARLQTIIDGRATQTQSVVMMTTKISELSKSIQLAAKQIETQPDMSSLLNQLAELGKQCQTELIDVQPQPHRDHSNYSIQPVRCVLQTDWSGLCYFVDGLSQLKLPVRVGSLQTSTDPNGQLGAT